MHPAGASDGRGTVALDLTYDALPSPLTRHPGRHGERPVTGRIGNVRMRIAIVGVLLAGLSASAQAPTGIDRVAWMAGCWSLASEGRTVEEQWMAPSGGSMLGISRTVKDGRLLEFEFVVLRERGEGLVYVAHPSGQPGGEFPMKSLDASSVIFENTQHDFPQRIGYRRDGDNVAAWIEGTMGGMVRKVEFPYRRVACPGS